MIWTWLCMLIKLGTYGEFVLNIEKYCILQTVIN